MSGGSVPLTVSDAYTRDVGRGVARMDTKSMGEIGASTGGVVEIIGRRRTAARCLPLYPSDEGRGIVRIDGLIRLTSGIDAEDTVRISRAHAAEAEWVIAEPFGVVPRGTVRLEAGPLVPVSLEAKPPIGERQLAAALGGICLTKGGVAMIPFSGDRILYRVLDATPGGGAVLVTKKTAFSIAGAGKPGMAGGR